MLEPIKGAWGGVKAFFGFGDNDESGDAVAGNAAARQTIVVNQARYAPPTITSASNLYMTNNIQTQDNPGAIARAVGRSAYEGTQRSNGALYQAMRGVRLK